MLAEFIDKIASLARAGENGFLMSPLARKVALRQDGKVELIDYPVPLRGHAFSSLDCLAVFAADPKLCRAPDVFFDWPMGGTPVFSLVPDRDARVERMSLGIRLSKQWEYLALLEASPKPRDIPTLVRELRFMLPDSGADAFAATIRNVSFRRDSSGKVDVQHGKESLGRSVEAAVQGITDIPERFRVQVRPFETDGLQAISVDVAVGVHLDVANELVLVVPLAGQLQKAQREALAQMHARIEEALSKAAGLEHCEYYQGTASFTG